MSWFTMNHEELNRLMQDKQYLDFQIGYYLKNKVIFPQEIKSGEILGHIEKAEHNLNFVKDILEALNNRTFNASPNSKNTGLIYEYLVLLL